jgi:hypothetical protein
MESRTTRSAILTSIAKRDRLRRALDRYVLDVARARHFAWHPAPRPTDTVRAEVHLDAARATERELIGALEALGAGAAGTAGTAGSGDDEQGAGRRQGLTFGIGGPEHSKSKALVSTAAGKSAPLARRVEAAHLAERCLRLMARAESLTGRPHPPDATAEIEVASGQLDAAGRAERVLWATLHALAG